MKFARLPLVLPLVLALLILSGYGEVVTHDVNGNLSAIAVSAGPAAPAIISHPVTQLAAVGQSVSFNVITTGNPAPVYQWKRGVDDIGGATSPTLFLTNLQAGDFANYTVVVTNSQGSATSNIAQLQLDSDGDNLPDTWETTNIGNLNSGFYSDNDNDGVVNGDEFQDGTNPTSSASKYFRLTLSDGITASPVLTRYPPSTVVTLTATPSPRLNFIEWSGDVTGFVNPATITMSADRTVTALRSEQVIDTTWLPNVTAQDGRVRQIVKLASGKYIIAGRFSVVNGMIAQSLARLNADFTPDSTFAMRAGTADNVEIRCVIEQPDGKLLVGGEFSTVNGISRRGMIRLLPDGGLDDTFNAANGLNGSVFTAALLGDGRIAIGGNFSTVGGVSRSRVAVLTSTGTLDTSFAPGTAFNGNVNSIALDTGNALVCGGTFTSFNSNTVTRIARLTIAGALDTTFNSGGTGANNIVEVVRRLSDGRFCVGGQFTNFNGSGRNYMAVLLANGSVDPAFSTGTNLNSFVNDVWEQADGKFVIGGSFTSHGSTPRNRLARLEATGAIDTTFGTPSSGAGNASIYALLKLTDGRLLIGGDFSTFSAQPRERLALADGATGALDASVEPLAAFRSKVSTLLSIPSDGSMLVGGEFTATNGKQQRRIVKILPDGVLDTNFAATDQPSGGPSPMVNALALQADGAVLVGGSFTTVGGFTHSCLTRYLPSGAVDPAWQPGTGFANGAVNALALDSAGRIYAGGLFDIYRGIEQPSLVRILPDGTHDGSFFGTVGTSGLPYSGDVKAITVQPDGKVIVVGSFTWASGNPVSHIARFNSDGTYDTTFNISGGASAQLHSVALLPDGRILVGGEHVTIGGLTRSYLSRLLADGTPDSTFAQAGGPNTTVYSVRVQPDGRILIAGDFSTVAGVVRNRLALLEPDGKLVETLNPGTGPDDNLYVTETDTAGRIHVGGWVREFMGYPRAGLMRLTAAPGIQVLMAGITPASPVPLGQMLTLNATATSASAAITALRFEASSDGESFFPISDGILTGVNAWSSSWMPPTTGLWFIRAIASDTLARQQASFAQTTLITAPPPAGFSLWVQNQFTAGEQSNLAVSGPLADPDADGSPNVTEYYFGTLPKSADSFSAPWPEVVTVGPSSYSALAWRCITNATDITATVEVSDSLLTWHSGPAHTTFFSTTPDGPGFEIIRVRDNDALPDDGFLRLGVSIQP